ncbi:ATP-binding cassette sub-family C member 4-like [Oculina patagonica]
MSYEKLGTEGLPTSPKETASFFSLLTFSWLNELLKRGNQRSLENDDLPALLKEYQSQALTKDLEKEWSRNCEPANTTTTCIKTVKLWRALFNLVPASEKAFVLILASTHIVLRLIQPLFLIGLIAELMKESLVDRTWTYLYAAGVCLSTWVIAISKCHCDYRSTMIGMRMRSALLGVIYKQVLQISLSDLTMMTTGHVITLISNDVQRLDRALRFLPNIILAPFAFVAGNVVLFYFIGWPVVIGMGYLLLILFYQGYGSRLAANLRHKAAVLTDKRVQIINEIIRGIRTIKICSWENYFGNLVAAVRGKEIAVIRKISAFQASIKTIVSSTPRLTSLLIFVAYLVAGHSLRPTSVFAVSAYAKVLGMFIKYLGRRLVVFLDCNMSIGRIQKFLEVVEDSNSGGRSNSSNVKTGKGFSNGESYALSNEYTTHQQLTVMVSLTDVCCKYNEEDKKLLLNNVSIKTDGAQIVMITGPVGSGKSSLLLTILGELSICKGILERKGKMAFVAQSPWVFSGTLRDNITFNKPFDSKKFQAVVEDCALAKDIEQFPNGDLTTIGERGVVLSGGQRARVSMARALYSDADIYLLDDPLSSVDAQVGSHIFENYICNALQDRLCIFVTHQPCYMKQADHIVVMNEGSIACQGSHEEIVSKNNGISGLEKRFEDDQGNFQSGASRDLSGREKREFQSCEETSLIIPKEDRNFGAVSYRTYWKYFRAGLPVYLMIPLVILSNSALVSEVFPDWLMAQWNHVSWSSSRDRFNVYLYTGLALGSTLLLFFSAFLFFQATINSSRNLHSQMFESVLRAPVHFFDTNPSGRICNRFSKDIGLMDEMLFAAFYDLFETFWKMFLSVGIPSVANYWVVFAAIPLIGLVTFYGRYCLNISREVARLEAINRSPVYSHFSLTLDGIVNIRTYHQQEHFAQEFFRHQDNLAKTWFVSIAVVRWLHFRMDCITSLFLTAVTAIAVMTSQHAGLTGLAIIYCMDLLEGLDFTVRQCLEVENMMTSVERVISYTNLDSEPGYSLQKKPLRTWPVEGRIEVKDVSLVYYSGGPAVLRDLNVSFAPAEKIGIAGRTGAGKSSFVATLMRMPEPGGQILIDDQNIQELTLPIYRTRISVIPQDPVLFSGPLRLNLDPGIEFEDAQIWNALEAVQLKSLIQKQDGQLYYEIAEGGTNFSVGERQLLCLARALLQQNKVIILDEATANVDFATDRLIQETIRSKFHGCTVITIAHRVDTILDYDRVLVFQGGRVVEFDKPEVLLKNEAGKFAELCRLQQVTT